MGVRGLLSYVKKKLEYVDPETSPPQRIGIDIYGLLYIWRDDLEAIQKCKEAFIKAGHKCIFVFDGEAPAEKKEVIQKRKNRREEASLQLRALKTFLESEEGKQLDDRSRQHLEKQIHSLGIHSWQITRDYKHKVLKVLEDPNVKIVLAKGEADDELVRLEKEKQIDVILSSDMDFVRFGVNRIWIPCFKENSYKCYDFDIPYFCAEENIPIEGLADVAKLCGSETEYTQITPSEALSMIRYYGSLQNLLKFQPNKIKLKQL